MSKFDKNSFFMRFVSIVVSISLVFSMSALCSYTKPIVANAEEVVDVSAIDNKSNDETDVKPDSELNTDKADHATGNTEDLAQNHTNEDVAAVSDSNDVGSSIRVNTIVKGKVRIVEAVKCNLKDGEQKLSGNVYLSEDVTISGAITVDENSSLNLIIKDGVTVKIDATNMEDGLAGINCCDSDRSLSITAGTDDASEPQGSGKLIVYGCESGAAIGGKTQECGYNMTIESCNIEAHGGEYAAGIGGGWNDSAENITINGGKVMAWGGERAPGIGGGYGGWYAPTKNITINGGMVYAYGGKDGGAGIGGGASNEVDGIYINENIPGIKTYVEAYGGEKASGIGAGDKGSHTLHAHDIYITGGTIKAYGGGDGNAKNGGAGIGGGNNLEGYKINISGGDVYAEAKNQAAAIGGGSDADGYEITISGGNVVANAYGSDDYCDGAGIGGGRNNHGYNISISGGTVNATSGHGAGIGGGTDGKLDNKNCFDVNFGVDITGGHVEAFSRGDGAGIGGGSKGGCDGSVTISGSTTYVNAYAEGGGAGIGGGLESDSHNITINDGTVISKSKNYGAGIGSGKKGKAKDTIRIAGGNVTATGGGSENSCSKKNNTGCAIGCGACDKNPAEGWINAVYVSTDLDAKFSYNDGGTYSQSIVPYEGNWATDNTHNENCSLWRDVKISNNVQRGITIGDQTDVAEYGTASTSAYDLIANYVSGTEWPIQWYKDGEITDEAPASYYIMDDGTNKKLYLDYDGNADAGNYSFTISCDGITSNQAPYKINKRMANITSGSAIKIYDGTPLTCDSYETTGFIEDQGVYVTCTGTCTGSETQTEPTKEPNTFDYTAQDGTNLDNYEITKTEGTLTVVIQLFVVTAGNYKGIYDGYEQQFNDVSNGTQVKVTTKNAIDYSYEASFKYQTAPSADGPWSGWSIDVPSIKDAGKLYVRVQATVTIEGYTATIEAEDIYTMEVTKRNVTITSDSADQEYNGEALTAKNATYGCDDFVNGEGAYITYYGSQTLAGSSINDFSYELYSNTNENNYKIDIFDGILTVTPKSTPITISTLSSSKTYDGDVIYPGQASWTDGVLVSGDELNVTLDRTGDYAVKNAGSYANDIDSYKVTNKDEVDVTNCYTFAQHNIGTLIINKRPVTLESDSDLEVWTQEGDCAYSDHVTEDGDGLVEGEELIYSDFQTVTEISYTPIDNTFTYSPADGSSYNENNYEITQVYGKLALVAEMTIVSDDQTFIYDGTDHDANVTLIDSGEGATVEIEYATSKDGKEYSQYSPNIPTIKNSGILYIKAKATKGKQTSEASYTATMEKRSVVITTDSDSKSYDGKALTNSNYTFSGLGFAEGEGAEVNVTGSQIDVGNSQNSFDYKLDDNTNKDNYIITKEPGTLTVTHCASTIAITTGSNTAAYNGTALTSSDWTALFGTNTVAPEEGSAQAVLPDTGDTLIVTCAGSITDVGKVSNPCIYRVERNGVDVTANYCFAEPVCGSLTVTQRSIVINTASASKVYDAQALTANKYTQTGDGFISGQGFESVNIAGTCTNAGTVPNTLNVENPYTLNKNTNPANYSITSQLGTLTVEKRNVVVTSGNAIKTASAVKESGQPAINAEVTVTGDRFVADEMAKDYPMGTGSQTNVGESLNYIAYSWINTGNPANYQITENLGKLAVIDDGTVPSGVVTGYSGVYDGQEHTGSVVPKDTAATVKYSIDGILYDLDKAPTYSDVGDFTVYARISTKDLSSTADYTFQVQIAPREVSLVSADAFKYYDGSSLVGNVNEVTGTDQFVSGEFDKVTMTGSQTKAGNSQNSFDVSLKEDAKVTNYNIYKSYGMLTVCKRQVTVESGSAIKTESVAKISPATNPLVTVSGDKFVEGELQSDYPMGIGSQSLIGESANKIEYKWNEGFSSDNYDITEILGTLKVVADDECGAVATGYEGIYDGQYHGGTVIPALEGSTIKYYVDESLGPETESPTYKDVCEHTINALVSYESSSCIVSYDIKITERQAVISTGSAGKVYDGSEITCKESKIEGFVDGESVNITVDGSQTFAGSSQNNFSIDGWIGGAKADNYDIIEQPGILSVAKRPITVTSGSAVKTASTAKDDPAKNPDVQVTSGNFISGELQPNYPKATGSQSEVGESANTIEYEWNSGFSGSNYEITEVLGRLVVVEDSRAAAVATGYEGIYDGQPHGGVVTPAIVDASIEYYVDGSEKPVTENPTFTDAGKHFIVANVTYGSSACTVSYKVKIDQRPITITADSAEKVYDGKPLTCESYTIGGAGLVTGENPNIKMTADSTVTDVNTTEVYNDIDVDALKERVGNYNYENYVFSIFHGTLNVTKRPLILYSKPIGVTEKSVLRSNALNAPDSALLNNEDDFDALLQTQDAYKQIADLGNAADIYKELQAIGKDPVLYDGKKHSDETIIEVGKGQVEGIPVIPDMGFAEGEGATYSNFRSFKDAATYMNTFKVSWNDCTDKDNYDFKILFGAVTIDKREIVFASADDSKIYDGLPLTNDTVTVSGDGFAEKEGADFNVTGSQTEVGQSDNSFEYDMWENTKDSNYDVTCNTGTLTVLVSDKLSIILPTNTCFTYDGNPHGDPAYATIDGQITEDVTVMYSVDGVRYTSDVPQITEIGSLNVSVLAEADGYKTATGSYTLTVQQGDTPQPTPIDNPTSGGAASEAFVSDAKASATSSTEDGTPFAGLIGLVLASSGIAVFVLRKRKSCKSHLNC